MNDETYVHDKFDGTTGRGVEDTSQLHNEIGNQHSVWAGLKSAGSRKAPELIKTFHDTPIPLWWCRDTRWSLPCKLCNNSESLILPEYLLRSVGTRCARWDGKRVYRRFTAWLAFRSGFLSFRFVSQGSEEEKHFTYIFKIFADADWCHSNTGTRIGCPRIPVLHT